MAPEPIVHQSRLAHVVFQLFSLLDAHQLGDGAARDRGLPLTWLQVRVLWHIGGSGCISQTDLAERLGTSAPTTSKLCARLDTLGYVTQRTGQDRRVRNVELTPIGQRAARLIYLSGDDLINGAASNAIGLDASALADDLSRLLDPLAEYVHRMTGAPSSTDRAPSS